MGNGLKEKKGHKKNVFESISESTRTIFFYSTLPGFEMSGDATGRSVMV